MRVRINLLQSHPVKRVVGRKALMAVILTVPLIFGSCSIFTPQPDSKASKDPDQVYKSQRAKRPGLSAHESPDGNPPFWYRGQRMNPETLSSEAESPEPLSTETPTSLPEKSFSFPEIFTDDLDQASLKKAILNQLQTMEFTDPSKTERMGNLMVTRGWLQETLTSFLNLIKENLPLEEFSRRLKKEFVIHRVGKGKHKQVLFTGYYAPTMEASRVKTKLYRYPIYKLPESSPHLKLVGNDTNYNIRGSSNPGAREWRNYTRRQIDGEGVLAGQGLEIAWLKNDVDRFFLHIQGSGQLMFRDGMTMGAHYAGVNNYKFGGLGKRMVADGVIELAQGSMQGIKKYFTEHPEDIEKYLFQNKRYIFFKLAESGSPRGSGGSELVGGRSIATDKKIYPAGGLAFVQLRKPVLDKNNKIVRWEKFSRFMIDQDTGNAIRGTGRADFYFGIGDRAGAKAGHFHERGDVFYIVKRMNPGDIQPIIAH
ncbi:MAG: MltA domain-containing protein [Nitrospinaceae bacterium]|jgi:membrane-bound lytic murein transglycosylase A|nr:MltA domain-containing protein [Nitrospinaceae bacterium]MDP7056839.1 MltA domain-containing protein [Nitrospinaceae bacterium]